MRGSQAVDSRTKMVIQEIMTEGVVTSAADTEVVEVAGMMRDHNVGSVVIVDDSARPIAMVTDRDLAISVLADSAESNEPVANHCTKPIVCGEPEMELEEAAALMVKNGIRRLPVVSDKKLVGIVALDDIAIRTGDLEVAKQMTQQVTEAALPEYYFQDRD